MIFSYHLAKPQYWQLMVEDGMRAAMLFNPNNYTQDFVNPGYYSAYIEKHILNIQVLYFYARAEVSFMITQKNPYLVGLPT